MRNLEIAPVADFEEASAVSTPVHERLQWLEQAFHKKQEKERAPSPGNGLVHNRLQWIESEKQRSRSLVTPDNKDANDRIPPDLVEDRKRWVNDEILSKMQNLNIKGSSSFQNVDARNDVEDGKGRLSFKQTERLSRSPVAKLNPEPRYGDNAEFESPCSGFTRAASAPGSANSLAEFAQQNAKTMAEAKVANVVSEENHRNRLVAGAYRRRRSLRSWRQQQTHDTKRHKPTESKNDYLTVENLRNQTSNSTEEAEPRKMQSLEEEQPRPTEEAVLKAQHSVPGNVRATDVQCLDFCTIL